MNFAHFISIDVLQNHVYEHKAIRTLHRNTQRSAGQRVLTFFASICVCAPKQIIVMTLMAA